MITYIIKYSIYFKKKTELQQKGEIEIEDGANIDFINKDTNLVIESVLTKK